MRGAGPSGALLHECCPPHPDLLRLSAAGVARAAWMVRGPGDECGIVDIIIIGDDHHSSGHTAAGQSLRLTLPLLRALSNKARRLKSWLSKGHMVVGRRLLRYLTFGATRRDGRDGVRA